VPDKPPMLGPCQMLLLPLVRQVLMKHCMHAVPLTDLSGLRAVGNKVAREISRRDQSPRALHASSGANLLVRATLAAHERLAQLGEDESRK
jgi:hypothetical protein